MAASIADPATRMRHVFLRDMTLEATIGIHPHERAARQRIRINVDLGVQEEADTGPDRLERVVDYEHVATSVRQIATAGHINLVELWPSALPLLAWLTRGFGWPESASRSWMCSTTWHLPGWRSRENHPPTLKTRKLCRGFRPIPQTRVSNLRGHDANQ